jgi:hypothetical protein
MRWSWDGAEGMGQGRVGGTGSVEGGRSEGGTGEGWLTERLRLSIIRRGGRVGLSR